MKEVRRKIYFIPAPSRVNVEDQIVYVHISSKYSSITFAKETIDALQMNGKFIKLYYAEPNIIGWRLYDKLDQGEFQSKNYRLVKLTVNNQYRASIAPLLSQIKIQPNSSYKCEVKKYVEMSGTLEKGDVYYFSEITNDSLTKKSRGGSRTDSDIQEQDDEVSNDSLDTSTEVSGAEDSVQE